MRLGGSLLTRCIFCRTPFPENGVFGRLPPGRRLAFDPGRGRLWVVCERCHRWNLCPIENRWEALHQLERMVRDASRLVAETDNIVLLSSGELFRAGFLEIQRKIVRGEKSASELAIEAESVA